MIGVYDFCGHYEWVFEWLEKEGGLDLVHSYWDDGINRDSQIHARELVIPHGIDGMVKYWHHTLDEEAAGYTISHTATRFRIDMSQCPSKGFLLANHLEQYSDYCDHCMGWTGPLMRDAGYVIDHEHNHCGQCWWEMKLATDTAPPSAPGELSGDKDVRHLPNWISRDHPFDVFRNAISPKERRRIEPGDSGGPNI